MNRFELEFAIHHRAITASDGEEIRPAVAGTPFRAFEKIGRTRGQITIVAGMEGETVSLTLQTDDAIAATFRKQETVRWKNYDYLIATVGAIPSSLHRGAKEYLIGLH